MIKLKITENLWNEREKPVLNKADTSIPFELLRQSTPVVIICFITLHNAVLSHYALVIVVGSSVFWYCVTSFTILSKQLVMRIFYQPWPWKKWFSKASRKVKGYVEIHTYTLINLRKKTRIKKTRIFKIHLLRPVTSHNFSYADQWSKKCCIFGKKHKQR